MKYRTTISAVLLVAAGLALTPDAARAAASPGETTWESAQRDAARESAAAAAAAEAKKRKVRMNDRCNTPAINCILFDRQPAGSSCWCVTPFGPSYGRVP